LFVTFFGLCFARFNSASLVLNRV